jgi:hypothetical protein
MSYAFFRGSTGSGISGGGGGSFSAVSLSASVNAGGRGASEIGGRVAGKRFSVDAKGTRFFSGGGKSRLYSPGPGSCFAFGPIGLADPLPKSVVRTAGFFGV